MVIPIVSPLAFSLAKKVYDFLNLEWELRKVFQDDQLVAFYSYRIMESPVPDAEPIVFLRDDRA